MINNFVYFVSILKKISGNVFLFFSLILDIFVAVYVSFQIRLQKSKQYNIRLYKSLTWNRQKYKC